jgi:hypothetical protein
MSFPLSRKNERVFPDGYDGEVFVCDIDRTDLATRFSSLRGLATIPLEFAIDKLSIEGMVALLKEIRRGPGARSRHTPLFFVSASPSQLRGVIERKMLLDGLEYDGTTFKDWGKVLLGLTPRRLREQVGFKVTALVSGRQELPSRAREVLLGDDLEQDALAYALYADYLGRRLSEGEVLATMRLHGVSEPDLDGVRRLRRLVPDGAGVARALIRLERHAQAPEHFLPFAPGVLACRGAFQMALTLHELDCVALAGVLRVARELLARGATPQRLGEQLADAVARALVPAATAERAQAELVREGVLALPVELPAPERAWAEAMQRPLDAPWTPAGARGQV